MEYTATEKKWMKSRTGSGAILAKTSCEDLVEGLGWMERLTRRATRLDLGYTRHRVQST